MAELKSKASGSEGIRKPIDTKVAVTIIVVMVITAVLLIGWSQGLFGEKTYAKNVPNGNSAPKAQYSEDSPMGKKRNNALEQLEKAAPGQQVQTQRQHDAD